MALLIFSLHDFMTSLQCPNLHTSSPKTHKLKTEFHSFAAPQWLSHPSVCCPCCVHFSWAANPATKEGIIPLWAFSGGFVGFKTTITFAATWICTPASRESRPSDLLHIILSAAVPSTTSTHPLASLEHYGRKQKTPLNQWASPIAVTLIKITVKNRILQQATCPEEFETQGLLQLRHN